MKPELKAKWVAALRSGEYPQGKDFLQSNGKFCCLGVLCEVAGIHGQQLSDNGAAVYLINDQPHTSTLTRNLHLFELDLASQAKLMGKNDGGHTFDSIADWIEDHL
jgi:hypothetical protein